MPSNRTPRFIAARFVILVLCSILFRVLSGQVFAQAHDADTLLSSWLKAQTNMQTWSADFTQTRVFKSMSQPLTAAGHVWFEAPSRFRWELGKPPRTIAVREPDQLVVLYPRLKRAERYPLNTPQAGPWKDTMALLDAGFPRSREELESRFNILSQTTTDHFHEITLQPKAATARRLMPQIKITFDTGDFSLHSTELQFTDNSTMLNVFTNAALNPKLDDSLFSPKIGEDYKITEPRP
ncbi:MAG TPA: outer membrane lipoprotein carrier protein LolA [Verrucomicrobiae bacterium]|nr:outer membrane lipoprotein carrier protein LolA [Verrucomicrobiae bacterium]